MPLFPSQQHPFSTCLPLSLLPTSNICHTLHLCFTVSLHYCPFFCSYTILSPFIFPSLSSVLLALLTSVHDFIPSSPPYLPTRLVITSSTVELMAQFRKRQKEETRSPFIRSIIQFSTRDKLLYSCVSYMQYTFIYVYACMLAYKNVLYTCMQGNKSVI